MNSLIKVMSGWWSDRQTKRRPIVIAGYALSSAVRPLIAVAGTWAHVLLIRVLDRTGKGIRSAPRDAMLTRLSDAASSSRYRVLVLPPWRVPPAVCPDRDPRRAGGSDAVSREGTRTGTGTP